VAEAAITAMAIQLGLVVLRPAAEVDVIAAYSPELHRGFLIPIDEASGRRAIHLRLDPTRNNQAHGIKWARDYEFAPAIERLRTRSRENRAEPVRLHFPS
jgi:hypothetical protein